MKKEISREVYEELKNAVIPGAELVMEFKYYLVTEDIPGVKEPRHKVKFKRKPKRRSPNDVLAFRPDYKKVKLSAIQHEAIEALEAYLDGCGGQATSQALAMAVLGDTPATKQSSARASWQVGVLLDKNVLGVVDGDV